MFVTGSHFCPSLIFVDKGGASSSGGFYRTTLIRQDPSLVRKCNTRLTANNCPAYYGREIITALKSFIVQAPEMILNDKDKKNVFFCASKQLKML